MEAAFIRRADNNDCRLPAEAGPDRARRRKSDENACRFPAETGLRCSPPSGLQLILIVNPLCRCTSTSYFPIQNSLKIRSRRSSTSTRPVMRPSARIARRRSSTRSSGSAAALGAVEAGEAFLQRRTVAGPGQSRRPRVSRHASGATSSRVPCTSAFDARIRYERRSAERPAGDRGESRDRASRSILLVRTRLFSSIQSRRGWVDRSARPRPSITISFRSASSARALGAADAFRFDLVRRLPQARRCRRARTGIAREIEMRPR